MLYQGLDIPGALSDEIGNILSPIIKLIVLILNVIIVFSMWQNYKKKLAENPEGNYKINKNLMLMAIFFAFAALFSSFDILIGWKDVFGVENAYLGISSALLFTGIAASIYYWFLLEVFYSEELDSEDKHKKIKIFTGLQIGNSLLSLIFRTSGSRLYLIFNVIQAILLIYLFTLIIRKSKALSARIPEEEYSKRFKNIVNSSIFGLITIIMFLIDAFSNFVTIYSLIGWLCLIGTSYSLYKAYV